MLPLVSVIMPAYNAEKYIGDAIESVLNQTYQNYELIIIEDSSSDKTWEVITKYKDNLKIRYYKNNENKGIAYSTNMGIEMAKGKYIALLDDDDIATPNRLQLQVTYMESHRSVDILGGRTKIIDERGNIIRASSIPRYNSQYIKAVLNFRCMDFRNGTTMIRKAFIDKNELKYEENCQGMQDFEFFVRCSKLGEITTIEDFLLLYRVHNNNETKRRFEEYSDARRKKYAEIQRKSLCLSGFVLSEEQYCVINEMIDEKWENIATEGKIKELYKVFKEILLQARMMELDYYNELELYCRELLAKKIQLMIHF